ncbi:MAG: hypothetical protein J0H48_09780 [Nitrosospira multiformis]|nr:hypothetical protein [Nitrosospira multiformis]
MKVADEDLDESTQRINSERDSTLQNVGVLRGLRREYGSVPDKEEFKGEFKGEFKAHRKRCLRIMDHDRP